MSFLEVPPVQSNTPRMESAASLSRDRKCQRVLSIDYREKERFGPFLCSSSGSEFGKSEFSGWNSPEGNRLCNGRKGDPHEPRSDGTVPCESGSDRWVQTSSRNEGSGHHREHGTRHQHRESVQLSQEDQIDPNEGNRKPSTASFAPNQINIFSKITKGFNDCP